MSERALTELWNKSWNLLKEAQHKPGAAFSTPVVATVSPEGLPHSRTIVLRKAIKDKGEFWCYTDRRSQKAQDLAEGSTVMSWTFWDLKQSLQVNASGVTRWMSAAIAGEQFLRLPKHSRKAYATLSAPGLPLPAYSDGLPDNWEERQLQETAYAAENFGVLCTSLDRMEILHLDRDGHQRMLATRDHAENWTFHWIIP